MCQRQRPTVQCTVKVNNNEPRWKHSKLLLLLNFFWVSFANPSYPPILQHPLSLYSGSPLFTLTFLLIILALRNGYGDDVCCYLLGGVSPSVKRFCKACKVSILETKIENFTVWPSHEHPLFFGHNKSHSCGGKFALSVMLLIYQTTLFSR